MPIIGQYRLSANYRCIPNGQTGQTNIDTGLIRSTRRSRRNDESVTYFDTAVLCTSHQLVVIKRRPVNAVDFPRVTSYVVYRRRTLLQTHIQQSDDEIQTIVVEF